MQQTDVDGGFILKVRRKGDSAPGDFSEALRVTKDRDVLIGGTLPSAPNISLNADGLVKAKDYATGTGVALTYWGEVIARNDSANAASFSSYQNGTSASNVKARIYSDGNAYFGGYIFQGNPLHNPNIALNASDGSASFAGDVGIGTNATPLTPLDVKVGTDNHLIIGGTADGPVIATCNDIGQTEGSLTYRASDHHSFNISVNEKVRINELGNVFIGGTLPSAPNISLNASGSAEFAGTIEQGTFNTSSSAAFGIKNNISSLAKQGAVNVQHAWDANTTANAFAVYKAASDGGTVDPTVEIKGDGSATFAGRVYSGTDNVNGLGFHTKNVLGTNGAFAVINGSDTKAVIKGDGSATFGGTGLVDISNPAYLNGAQIGSRIRFLNTNGDPAANAETWATITVNGSPGFAQAGPLLFQVKNSATDGTQKTIAGVSTFGFNVYDPNAPYVGNDFNVKILLGTDGNIAADNVTFKLEPDDDSNYTTTTEEYTETETYEGPRGRTLEREVTKTREVKTYTGPTMDVKDTLLKITEALTQLKTAAASATTCEELRTAIDTALADV